MAVFADNSDLDITLQKTNGQLALWQANGHRRSPPRACSVLTPAPDGTKGTGAFFSGDTSDILLQNTDGTVEVWQMQSATFVSGDVVANPGPHWHVKGTGDFNADGQTDMLLQKTVAVSTSGR